MYSAILLISNNSIKLEKEHDLKHIINITNDLKIKISQNYILYK